MSSTKRKVSRQSPREKHRRLRIIALSDNDIELFKAYGELGGKLAADRTGKAIGYIYQRVSRVKVEIRKADLLRNQIQKLCNQYPRLRRSFIIIPDSISTTQDRK